MDDIFKHQSIVDVQNRSINRNHSREELDFSESMREIVTNSWDHLPSDVRNNLYIGENGTDIIFRLGNTETLLTPSSADQITSLRALQAFGTDAKYSGTGNYSEIKSLINQYKERSSVLSGIKAATKSFANSGVPGDHQNMPTLLDEGVQGTFKKVTGEFLGNIIPGN